MNTPDLQTRPILPDFSSDGQGKPPKIEMDAFLMKSGHEASNCVPSNCPMFTTNYGDRPTLDSLNK